MFRNIVLIFSLLMGSSIASAGNFTGKILELSSGNNLGTILIVAVDGAVVNKEACNNNTFWDFSIDTQDVGADVWVTMLLSAHAANKAVVLTGTGSCTNWPNIEDISNIRLLQ